jgi:putative membrane protein insertion efficiency factor
MDGTRNHISEMRYSPKFVALQLLRGYKSAISPLLPPSCRYIPTCSDYATEAVERYGVLRGSWMALTRILRCHPFVRGGCDPVVKRAPATSDQRPTTISDCSLQGNP